MNRSPDHLPFYRLSALRQAGLMTLAFVLVLIAAGMLAFGEMARAFDRRIEAELSTRFAVIARDIRQNGFDPEAYPDTGLERVIYQPGQNWRRQRFIDDPDFDRRGFGKDDHRHRKGWDDDNWLYLAGPADGGGLIVGTHLGRQAVFAEIAFQTLGFVGFLSAVIAALLGLFFGWRNQRRVSAISRTLTQVASGDLQARVGARRRRDDLDALAHRVDDTTARLDVLLRQTRDFSANIAHDLKTPLARLRLRLETALVAETETGDSADQIGAALEQTDRVIAIFDAFLRIAKLESGATQASFAPVDLTDIAAELADTYGAVIEDTGRHLTTELAGPALVQGDRVLLIQMLANMIENALRHTPDGTQLRLVARDGEIGLADDGPGIPDAEIDKVTQPLYRLEKSRTTDGAGLGLSLVKTIAELHGARLVLSGDPQSGKGLYIRAVFDRAQLTNL